MTEQKRELWTFDSTSHRDSSATAEQVHVCITPRLEGRTERILGWDAAGIVETVGPDVTRFNVGDHVSTLSISRVTAATPSTNWWMSGSSSIARSASAWRKRQPCSSLRSQLGKRCSTGCECRISRRGRSRDPDCRRCWQSWLGGHPDRPCTNEPHGDRHGIPAGNAGLGG